MSLEGPPEIHGAHAHKPKGKLAARRRWVVHDEAHEPIKQCKRDEPHEFKP